MKFLIDAMFPPEVVDYLMKAGHDAASPSTLGNRRMTDQQIVSYAASESMVIVTENTKDFAAVKSCPVLFALKVWWPTQALPRKLSEALDLWAKDNPRPGSWFHWLEAKYR